MSVEIPALRPLRVRVSSAPASGFSPPTYDPAAQEAQAKTKADRMQICLACPEAIEFKVPLLAPKHRCRKCNCVCEGKTAIPAAKCPLGKW